MSAESKIQWTDSSWPVTVGCEVISSGCTNCYAAKLTSGRLRHRPEYAGLAVGGKFTGEVRCLPERLDWPLKWRKPRRIFVCSMSDLFHKDVSDEFIARVFAVMAVTPQHTYQVLSKRHGRMRALLSGARFHRLVADMVPEYGRDPDLAQDYVTSTWPLPNVWAGVSVENQEWANVRIPALLGTRAAVRFISAEPLLGRIDLHAKDTRTFGPQPLPAMAYGVNMPDHRAGDGTPVGDLYATMYGPNLNWVILGGESGPGARPMDLGWARLLVKQCQESGVPVFVKQLGSSFGRQHHDIETFPEDLRVREYPEVHHVH